MATIEQLRQANIALRQEAILATESPMGAEPPASEPQAAQAGVVARAR
jgi:hypothetical protein